MFNNVIIITNIPESQEDSESIYTNEGEAIQPDQQSKVEKREAASILFSSACNSFSIIDNPCLLGGLKALNSNFISYTPDTLKIKMKAAQQQLKRFIYQKLEKKPFFLVHDHWTDKTLILNAVVAVCGEQNYLITTIVTPSQKADDIEKGLSNCLLELELSNLKPSGFVSDSAPNAILANNLLFKKHDLIITEDELIFMKHLLTILNPTYNEILHLSKSEISSIVPSFSRLNEKITSQDPLSFNISDADMLTEDNDEDASNDLDFNENENEEAFEFPLTKDQIIACLEEAKCNFLIDLEKRKEKYSKQTSIKAATFLNPNYMNQSNITATELFTLLTQDIEVKFEDFKDEYLIYKLKSKNTYEILKTKLLLLTFIVKHPFLLHLYL
uniref:Uncharacterized protein n=1 Tax=Rhabditophanes sp. KR3021 TaxID=114890 RepID=A0AC35TYA4_9BILA